MANYPITIEIEANSEAEAIEKIEAFIQLNDSMEHQDFVECAAFVADYPTVVTTIKNTLPKIADKSTFELVASAPDLIKDIKNKSY